MRDERWVDRFLYVWDDSLFYEPLDTYYCPQGRGFADVLTGEARERAIREGIWWVVYYDEGAALPEQGWKIHVSAHPGNAERVLAKAASYFEELRVAFKFALDRNVLVLLNSKAMARGSSGKFITAYPASVQLFREVIQGLAERITGEAGAYILSDLRYKDSRAVYFRYGAFRQQYIVDELGRRIPAIATPALELVPDRREPYFAPPAWVAWPFDDWTPPEGDAPPMLNRRYEVLEALSFSNSGGVYLARDLRTGRRVVIKEARPYTNFDPLGSYDAQVLLRREWEILRQLNGTGVAPRPIELFEEWEHLFLAEEYVEGIDIRAALFRKHHPLLAVRASRQGSARYLRSFFRLFRSFARAIQAVHSRGVLLGDLSARNFLLKKNTLRVVLIDFEASMWRSEGGAEGDELARPVLLYTPGFRRIDRARQHVYDEYDDLYSLASMMAYFIYPISAYAVLRPELFRDVYPALIRDMGWPLEIHDFIVSVAEGERDLGGVLEFLTEEEERMVRRVTTPPLRSVPTATRWDVGEAPCSRQAREWAVQIARFLEQAADPARPTLFPSDPFAVLTNPLSLGFGAGGVLYALHKAGFSLNESWRKWFIDRARRADPQDFPPGLLTGLAGIAWVLLELGEVEVAREVLGRANHHPSLEDYTLYYGLSGVGLANLHFYLHDRELAYLDAALDIYRRLASRAQRKDGTAYWVNRFSGDEPFTGLGFGQSGVALFLLRLHQLTGDLAARQDGEAALRFDLAQAERTGPGTMSFRYKGTLEPYVEVGSAGVAKVLLRYGWLEEARPLLNELGRKYSVLPGYLFGIAGVIDTLLDAYLLTRGLIHLARLERQLEGLRTLYLFEPRTCASLLPQGRTLEGLAVPGEGLLRVSCDFATGCAGVLRVLHRVASPGPADFMLDEVMPDEDVMDPPGGAQG
ncbi:class III lanthionine synthetase LanKC [Thermus albus]|uniref:class III lanthionine synthetase LanKC n=1 Tax=Thermus albus TaxID=2908146 RepID=UPI001FAB115F|nr:class III lanthionine synthetase LanKC [Thermus albus]